MEQGNPVAAIGARTEGGGALTFIGRDSCRAGGETAMGVDQARQRGRQAGHLRQPGRAPAPAPGRRGAGPSARQQPAGGSRPDDRATTSAAIINKTALRAHPAVSFPGAWNDAAFEPHAGRLLLSGRPTGAPDRSRGDIAMVHRELTVFPDLSLAENTLVSRIPQRGGRIDFAAMHARASRLLTLFELRIDPRWLPGQLTSGRMQIAEILPAVENDAGLLILGAPTSGPNSHAAETPIGLIERLAPRGTPSSTSRTGRTRCRRSPTTSPCCATAASSRPCPTAARARTS